MRSLTAESPTSLSPVLDGVLTMVATQLDNLVVVLDEIFARSLPLIPTEGISILDDFRLEIEKSPFQSPTPLLLQLL
ncbi:hypothetical protein H6F74_19915 [Trichocoleus sp. FACHB-90]|uniref:hypothetical protein n=1 Tax=Cyanophyceae TaxID=3028117 RepID=UPI0016892CFB|nr:hypothetical protein [Trichocoleus sp. FACHB-90]MBD1928496.1 hypothetical protein [Trichocoleus sp. FACHB-90]